MVESHANWMSSP